MKRISICLSVLICCVLILSSCGKQNIFLFLSNKPINLNNFTHIPEMPVFYTGQRIYFTLVSKKDIESPVLRLQTIKLENKYGYPISQIEIPYAVDIERGKNKKVVADYFVLHQDGNYFIRIFSLDKLNRPLIQTEFIVKKR